MENQFIQRKNSEAKRAHSTRVPAQIRLPQVRFNPGSVPCHEMAEIAKIFYSTSDAKKSGARDRNGPESISSILPRVMTGIARLRQQRTN